MKTIVRRPRTLCLLLLAGGVALGLAGGGGAAPPRITAGGYTVLAADLHVHGWPDGIPPWDAVREARRRRLDVIALTSHNSMRGWWLWRHAPWGRDGVMVLPGDELTSVGYHMAIVGLERPIAWHQRAADAAAAAHAQGAVAILAHPSRPLIQRFLTDDDLRAVDGVEVAHPSRNASNGRRDEYVGTYHRAAALAPVAAIGSSDFHYTGPLGVCRTYLFVREETAAGVLEAIRSARTVACDGRGQTIGPPALARVVAARCRADAGSPARGDSPLARAGAALGWGALLALVLLGAPRDIK